MNILTITVNPAIDKSSKVPQLLAEAKMKCEEPRYEPGGGGINVSRAIKKLGGYSRALFQAGGPTGQRLQTLLDQEAIQSKAINTKGWTRENLIITEASSGRQYRFGMPGPFLERAEWTRFGQVLSTLKPVPGLVVASGSLAKGVPVDFYARLAAMSREIGARFILDSSGKALHETLKQEEVFLLKPNLKELAELTGQSQVTGTAHEKLAMQLVKEGRAEMVVVSLGAKGAVIATDAGIERVVPPSIVVKSTVGAGDSMVAGLTLAYARGKTPKEMLWYGVACGTAAAMSAGTELCRKEDVDRVYQWLQEMDHGSVKH